jgi:predicted O-methyltransferase YrrM
MERFRFKRPEVLGDIRSEVFVRPETLLRHAAAPATLHKVAGICERLSEDDFTSTMIEAYRKGLDVFGESWEYVDLTSMLHSVAELGQPENYLEIGVRRGRSTCMVASASPSTNIFAFDLWQENYAANDNPGPEFVRAELQRMGHRGRVEFVSGDSHKTIPEFLAKHPDLSFDLITVDGDHSIEGAWDDLANVVARLRVGGVIVFDDIDNPYCPGLDGVWDRFMKANPELSGLVAANPLGLGVAFAIRMWPDQSLQKAEKKGVRSWLRR